MSQPSSDLRAPRASAHTSLIWLLIILSFLGIADAWYLTASALTDTALSCDLGAALDGCNIVAKSAYSQLFGIPLALYGVGFFGGIFVLASLLLVMPFKIFYRALFLLSLAGAFASIIFLLIQFVLIKALCVYCIGSAFISFATFFVAHTLRKQSRRVHAAPMVL